MREKLLIAAVVAISLCPQQSRAERSVCDQVDRPPGIGLVLSQGARSTLYTGFNGAGVQGVIVMDLNAHPFAGPVVNAPAARARYGPGFHGEDPNVPRFLGTDFETLFGAYSVSLQQKCCANQWGTALTRSCYPTLEELHDASATSPPFVLPPPPGPTPVRCTPPKVCIDPPAPCPTCPTCPKACKPVPASILADAQQVMAALRAGKTKMAMRRVQDYLNASAAYCPAVPSTGGNATTLLQDLGER